MKIFDDLCYYINEFVIHLIFFEKPAHHPFLRHPLHLHSILNCFSFTLYLDSIGFVDGNNLQVHVSAKSPVKLQFLLAEEPPLFKSGEVQESEVYSLLHLVNKEPSQKHE